MPESSSLEVVHGVVVAAQAELAGCCKAYACEHNYSQGSCQGKLLTALVVVVVGMSSLSLPLVPSIDPPLCSASNASLSSSTESDW